MWGSRKLLKGTLADRSWAATLHAISAAGHSGQLTLKSDGKVYQVAFADGFIVGAESPAPADTVQRIALVNHFVQPASVAAAVRIIGRNHDDVEKFSDAVGLAGDAAARFKRRVLVQRAARTFAAERGDYVLEERVTIRVLRSMKIDVHAAIYHGMRMNLSEQRLAADLRQLGSRFILFPEAAAHLEKFGLDREADPVINALRGGTSVPELDATHRELDPRLTHAVLGALATCRVITALEARTAVAQDISIGRTPTPREPTITRVPTLRQPTTSSDKPVTMRAAGSSSGVQRAATAPFDGEQTTMRPAALSLKQIKHLIASRLAMIERGVDFFTFLGLPFNASAADARAAYLEIARYLRPERLAELGIHDDRDEARTVFAQAVIAMTTLTEEVRRADYLSSFRGRLSSGTSRHA